GLGKSVIGLNSRKCRQSKILGKLIPCSARPATKAFIVAYNLCAVPVVYLTTVGTVVMIWPAYHGVVRGFYFPTRVGRHCPSYYRHLSLTVNQSLTTKRRSNESNSRALKHLNKSILNCLRHLC